MKNVVWFFVVFFILLTQSLYFLSVGSTTTPSRQTLATFPQVDTNNQVNAFAWMEAGFTLASATTTCTFDSVFPVQSSVTLNGGSLHLTKDLMFNNTLTFVNGGSLFGNNYALIMPKSRTPILLPNAQLGVSMQIRNTNVILNSPLQVQSDIYFFGNSKIRGQGHSLTVPQNVSLFISSDSLLTFEDLILDIQSTSALTCLHNSSSVTFRNCILTFSKNIDFGLGSFSVEDTVLWTGAYKFNYTSGITSTIASNAFLMLDRGMTFSISPTLQRRNLLYMPDQSAGIYMNESSLMTGKNGLLLDNGSLYFDNKVTLSNQGRNTSESLEFGKNLNIFCLSESQVSIFGYVHYN